MVEVSVIGGKVKRPCACQRCGLARLREIYPSKSDHWLAALLQRMLHYVEHDGDMTDAPPPPTG